MIERISTLNSTYEVDFIGGRIRRTSGRNAPTPNQGDDGVWQAATIEERDDGSLLIDWADTARSWTLTSPVTHREEVVDPDHDWSVWVVLLGVAEWRFCRRGACLAAEQRALGAEA